MADLKDYLNQKTLDMMRGVATASEASKPKTSDELEDIMNSPSKSIEFHNQQRQNAGLPPESQADQYTSNAASSEDIDALNDPKLESIRDKNVAKQIQTDNTMGNIQDSSEGTGSSKFRSPEEYSKNARQFKQWENVEPSAKMVESTPDVGSKLEALEKTAKATPTTQLSSLETNALEEASKAGSMDSAIEKLNGLSDEALSKMGSLGKAVMQSKALKLAGKVAAPIGTLMEGKAGLQNLSQGKYLDASGNALGAASGAATMMGSTAALPLAAASLGVAGGAQMGRQQADSGVDENGMVSPSKEELTGQKLQGQNPTDLLAVNAMKYADQFGGSTPVPPSQSPSDQLDSLKSQYASEADSPSSMTPDQRVAAKLASQTQSIHGSPSSDGSVSPNSAPGQGFTDNTVAGLKAAQDETNRLKNLADLRSAAAMIMSGQQGLQHHTLPPSIEAELKLAESQKKGADDITSQFQARGEQEKNDPNSAASFQARQTAKMMLKQAGMNINIPDNVSAADLEKRFPQFQHLATTKETMDARKEMAGEKAKDRAAMLEIAKESKDKTAQDKAYTELRLKAETFRGNSEAQQASRNVLSARNAISLIQNKDPNSLTNQDLELLASEIAKIATGGVPSEHGRTALLPNNLQTKAAQITNFLTSKPSSANAAAYIKKNSAYLNDMLDNSQQTLDKFHHNTYKGYKGRLSDEQKQDFLQDYPGVAKMEGIAPKEKSTGQSPISSGKIKVSNGTQTFSIDPSDEADAAKDGYKRVQ
jgi:hypothetical protein